MRPASLHSAYTALVCLILTFVGPCLAVENRPGTIQWPLSGFASEWCIAQKTAIDCDLLTNCVWCVNPKSKFGTGCYPITAAKLLPSSWGVECDKEVAKPQSSEQSSAAGVQQSVCDGKPEASCAAPECVWCTSAAVGGGCYTPEEAKLLPKAIFRCKTTLAEEYNKQQA